VDKQRKGVFIMATASFTHTDEQIRNDVLAELRWDPQVQGGEIGVIVKDGIVTLTGWVDSYTKKWRAEEDVLRLAGVKAVANDIEIKLATERTDADIAAAAVRSLEWDADIPAGKIIVSVSKGWVTLKGDLEWQYQKLEAERVVRRLWGVQGVSNLIAVKPQATPSELKRKIEQALLRSAAIDANSITVEVQGSKALLKGKVRSWAEKHQAEQAAWLAPGITSVENKIDIVL
jgi:osmotically-inducible protein OsmY